MTPSSLAGGGSPLRSGDTAAKGSAAGRDGGGFRYPVGRHAGTDRAARPACLRPYAGQGRHSRTGQSGRCDRAHGRQPYRTDVRCIDAPGTRYPDRRVLLPPEGFSRPRGARPRYRVRDADIRRPIRRPYTHPLGGLVRYGQVLAAQVLLWSRDPEVSDGFHGLSRESRFRYSTLRNPKRA